MNREFEANRPLLHQRRGMRTPPPGRRFALPRGAPIALALAVALCMMMMVTTNGPRRGGGARAQYQRAPEVDRGAVQVIQQQPVGSVTNMEQETKTNEDPEFAAALNLAPSTTPTPTLSATPTAKQSISHTPISSPTASVSKEPAGALEALPIATSSPDAEPEPSMSVIVVNITERVSEIKRE